MRTENSKGTTAYPINVKFFKKLCKFTQEELKSFLAAELSIKGRSVEVADGFIYSPGEIPILVCAHLDTVHKVEPKIIFNRNGNLSSPYGIGGDDRCGIYMVLEIIKKLNVHVAFFEDEEIGGIGSTRFSVSETCRNLTNKINYVIELDRCGDRDAVFYECDNPDFTEFVTKSFWEKSYGSFTDICNICPELKCAGVNLSCGYHKAHTLDEYVVLSEMERSISETINLIERSDDTHYEYIEKVYAKWDYYDDYYSYRYPSDNYYSYRYPAKSTYNSYTIVFIDSSEEETEYSIDALSEAEALGWFMIDNPDRSYNDVLYIQ